MFCKLACFLFIFYFNGVDCEVMKLDFAQLPEFSKNNKFVLAYIHSESCSIGDGNECGSILEQLEHLSVALMHFEIKVVEVASVEFFGRLPKKHETDKIFLFYRSSVALQFQTEHFVHDELMEWTLANMESYVVQLYEDDFEHLTQASSGATTGDWFIMFQSEKCSNYDSVWETLAARLKNRINVAAVDFEKNTKLKKRFSIDKCPTILFLRNRKMYMYDIAHIELIKLQNFAEGWYVNVQAHNVPNQQTPFDAFIDDIVSYIKVNIKRYQPFMDKMEEHCCAISIIIIIVSSLLIVCCCWIFIKKRRSTVVEDDDDDGSNEKKYK